MSFRASASSFTSTATGVAYSHALPNKALQPTSRTEGKQSQKFRAARD
jgi:hypothetical protein